MIVADTNLIVYLLVQSEHTHAAERVLSKDPEWSVPLLWRSEFRNALVLHMRQGLMSLDQALSIMQDAEVLIGGREYSVPSSQVFTLAANSRLSAYDCEFVALAQRFGVPLVTSDSRIVASFPSAAISMDAFI